MSSMDQITLHLPAIPHTITNGRYSHCAFTGKVLRFSNMMRSRGFRVIHYGVESSVSGADKEITLMTVDEWNELRIASLKVLKPDMKFTEIIEYLSDESRFIGELANYSTVLYQEFNRRFKEQLLKEYQSTSTDLVMLPFGKAHLDAIKDINVISIESGIGYNDSFSDYRIFETYTWLHTALAKETKNIQNYWHVCPNYYDLSEWDVSLYPENTVGFFGRICDVKGCDVFSDIAKLFPDIEFVLCGQSQTDEAVLKYLTSPNITYKPPIHGKERSYFLGSLTCLITPSLFCEPFCGVSVEAQLCGTPVISSDFGGMVENIEQFKTGLRCHTLADYKHGVRMALDCQFDRKYIAERARQKWDMLEIAKTYEYAFKNILDVHNGSGGWYSDKSYIDLLP